ncbi:MAG: TolB family protein [Vicinamibacterales bacterium]
MREPSGADRQVTLDEGDHYTPFWLSPLEVAAFTRHRDTRAFSAIDVTTGTERELFQVDALPAPAGTSLHPVEGLNVEVNPSLTQVLTSRVRDGVANLWSVPLREGRPAGPATQLTAETDGGSFPHWSPDGGWVAYQCEAGDETHVCVVDAGGGHRAQLTHGRGLHFIGGWIGDRTILIAARRDAVWNVVALDRLTGVERALTTFTDARSYVRYPRWDAAGQRVLFERAESTGNIWRVGLPAER